MNDARRYYWALLLAAGIASTAVGLAAFYPVIGNVIREPDTIFLLPIENVPVIIVWSSWLFAGVVFLFVGLKRMVAVRHTSKVAIAAVALLSVSSVILLPLAAINYFDYRDDFEETMKCYSDYLGSCRIPMYQLYWENTVIFLASAAASGALGFVFLLTWRRQMGAGSAAKLAQT